MSNQHSNCTNSSLAQGCPHPTASHCSCRFFSLGLHVGHQHLWYECTRAICCKGDATTPQEMGSRGSEAVRDYLSRRAKSRLGSWQFKNLGCYLKSSRPSSNVKMSFPFCSFSFCGVAENSSSSFLAETYSLDTRSDIRRRKRTKVPGRTTALHYPISMDFSTSKVSLTLVVGMSASCYTSLASFSGRQFFLVCWAWIPPAMLLMALNLLFSCLSHWTMQAKSHPSSIPLAFYGRSICSSEKSFYKLRAF